MPDRFEQALAEKFAPCHAYAGPDIWACELSYLWAGGAPLMVRAGYADGRSVDRKLLDADRLTERSWAALPDDNGKEGAERIRFAYFFDIPGECTGPGPDDMTWDDEWRLIQGEFGVDVKKARFPPAYYAHFSWNDLEKGELVLQFWFYYPYDKWINNHEGDIEHITVLLQLEGEGEARFDPALDHQKVKGAVYRFHGKELELGAKDLIRIGARDRKQGDHVMVFVGGKGSDTLPFSKETWGGLYSGGSYPYPALFKGAGGWITNHDDTRTVARWIHAEDFRVIVLPEPDQIDYEARPDMSWFALNLFVGALETKPNHPIVAATGTGSPIQPGRKGSWNLYKDPTPLAYRRERAEAGAFSPPARWAVISAPESYRARAPKSE